MILMAGCGARDDNSRILLFAGAGTSRGDVAAVEAVLKTGNLSYSTISSWQLNAMAKSEIRRYRLLIVPGGNFIEIGKGLTSETTARVRDAVQDGLNYLGICAGGFFAGDSTVYNGLNLTSGVRFGFYEAERRGIRKAAVAITGGGSPTLVQYWEDGPEFSGWGNVVARYPDQTPAVMEARVGRGWVVLAGIHAEAPENWRGGMRFATPVAADNAYALTLVRAALYRTPLSR